MKLDLRPLTSDDQDEIAQLKNRLLGQVHGQFKLHWYEIVPFLQVLHLLRIIKKEDY